MKHNIPRRHFASILIFLLLTGVTPVHIEGRAWARAISDKEEIALGRQIAQDAVMRFGPNLSSKLPVAQRVRRIGMPLARLSSRKAIPYSYSVVDNEEVLNAFALPGGPVVITQKLVSLTQNDAELAYILAHETAHIDRRHSIQEMERMRTAQRIAAAFGRHWLGGRVVQGIISAGAAITYALWSLSYSREQEMEADLIGVRWMSRLGYDPRAAVHILSRMEAKYPASGQIPRYLASHPLPRARRAKILALINDEKLLQVAQKHGGPRLWANGPALPLPKPEAAVPEAAVPEAAVPEAAVPEAAVPEAAVPEATPSPTSVPSAPAATDGMPTPTATEPPTPAPTPEAPAVPSAP